MALLFVGFISSCKQKNSNNKQPDKNADPTLGSGHQQNQKEGLTKEKVDAEKTSASQEEVKKSEVDKTPQNKLAATKHSMVTVNVDKLVYGSGDDIAISIKNDSKESIFSHIKSGTPVFAIKGIQRKTAVGKWEEFFAQCQAPHCIYDIDAPAEIKPGESSSFKWKPLIFVNGTQETAALKSGEYRLVILFENLQKTEWIEIYTNEFKIK